MRKSEHNDCGTSAVLNVAVEISNEFTFVHADVPCTAAQVLPADGFALQSQLAHKVVHNRS